MVAGAGRLFWLTESRFSGFGASVGGLWRVVVRHRRGRCDQRGLFLQESHRAVGFESGRGSRRTGPFVFYPEGQRGFEIRIGPVLCAGAGFEVAPLAVAGLPRCASLAYASGYDVRLPARQRLAQFQTAQPGGVWWGFRSMERTSGHPILSSCLIWPQTAVDPCPAPPIPPLADGSRDRYNLPSRKLPQTSPRRG